jgi:hypothetical protein
VLGTPIEHQRISSTVDGLLQWLISQHL